MNPQKKTTKKPDIKKKSIVSEEQDPVKAAELKEKIISKKKVLFTEIDDEITGIYDKLKKYKMKNIYVVVPKRSIIFQSIVNLRILKRKAEDLNKNVYIITNDHNGMQLAQRAGFQVFDKLEGSEHPSLVSGKLQDDQMKISPLEASINTYEDDTPTRLKSKKISIAELIRRTKKQESTPAKKLTPAQRAKSKKKKEKNRYVLVSPNRQALTILITIAVLLLILIVYIAVPSATIKISPKSNTISTSANVTLADAASNQSYLDTHPVNVIASFPAETTVKRTVTYFTTGNKFQGKNATGKITIVNTSKNAWPLIEQTRFQNADGLVYRIQQSVNVPAASLSAPGKLEVLVIADEIDANGLIIGERGNITESTKFFLPGLSEANRQKIYGESNEPFTGGETITYKMVSEEDIEAAKGKMEAELINAAEEELQKAVLQMNQERNVQLGLLTGNGAIEIGTPNIYIDENLVGQMIESFEVSGDVYVKGIAYSYNELVEILKNKLTLSKSPEKRLIKIDTDSISLRLVPIEEGADTTRQKVTATIKGIEQYEISPDRENGRRIIDNIKDHILGKSVEEAENYIQQLPSINKVEISSWPAWSPNVPGVPDNIKVQVLEDF